MGSQAGGQRKSKFLIDSDLAPLSRTTRGEPDRRGEPVRRGKILIDLTRLELLTTPCPSTKKRFLIEQNRHFLEAARSEREKISNRNRQRGKGDGFA